MYLNDSAHFKNARCFPTKKAAEDVLRSAILEFLGTPPAGIKRTRPLHFVMSRAPGQFVPCVVLITSKGTDIEARFRKAGVLVTENYNSIE